MKVKGPNSEPVGRNNGLPTKAMAKIPRQRHEPMRGF